MNELIVILCDRMGIAETEARKSILLTSDYLRRALPENLAIPVEEALSLDDVTDDELRQIGLFQYP